MAIICGAVWGVIEWLVNLFSLNLLLAPGAGYAIGEVISLAVNRKRGTRLAIVGGIAVVISYPITVFFLRGVPHSLYNMLYHLLALALGIFVATTRLLSINPG